MGGELDDPIDHEWDQDFEEDLEDIKSSDPRRAKSIVKKCEAILKNPFKGEWKKWAMDGVYGLHDQEKVIIYELIPDLPPNSNEYDIDKVYFHRIVHHDDQQTAVTAKTSTNYGALVSLRLDYSTCGDVMEYSSSLFEAECIEVEDDNYDSDGLSIDGILVGDNAESQLRSLLPSEAGVDVDTVKVKDIVREEAQGSGVED